MLAVIHFCWCNHSPLHLLKGNNRASGSYTHICRHLHVHIMLRLRTGNVSERYKKNWAAITTARVFGLCKNIKSDRVRGDWHWRAANVSGFTYWSLSSCVCVYTFLLIIYSMDWISICILVHCHATRHKTLPDERWCWLVGKLYTANNHVTSVYLKGWFQALDPAKVQ